jgi:heme exporter protein A
MAETGSPVPVIRVEGLKKTYGHHAALKDVAFRAEAGESIVIFGPNGAGKTTLIKIIATIIRPTAGTVTIGGMTTEDSAEAIRRRIGVITHQTFLYGNLTARENLIFYSRLYEVPDAEARIREMAEVVGLSTRLEDRVATFSRGMQQRLSIARALLHRPTILLLDEPETGLDQQAITILREAMKLEAGVRRTILMTTHNMERGLEMSERLLILNNGIICHDCSTADLGVDALRDLYRTHTGVQA